MRSVVRQFRVWERALASEFCHVDPGVNVAVVESTPWRGRPSFEVLGVLRVHLLRFAHLAGCGQDVKDQIQEDGPGAPFPVEVVGGLRTEGVWRYVDRRPGAAKSYQSLVGGQ